AAQESIVVHDNGIVIDANRPSSVMFGCPVAELIGKNVLDLIAPESRELVQNNFATRFQGAYTAIGLRQDGSTFPAEIHTQNTLYRGQDVRVTVLRDVSERKWAESALRGRERQLRATFDGALDGMAILDHAGQFIDLNPAACALFGLPR